MVVKNGIPLTFFSSAAFMKLNGEIARDLGVSLDRDYIRALVTTEFSNQKNELKNLLKDRLFFSKVDGARENERIILDLAFSL